MKYSIIPSEPMINSISSPINKHRLGVHIVVDQIIKFTMGEVGWIGTRHYPKGGRSRSRALLLRKNRNDGSSSSLDSRAIGIGSSNQETSIGFSSFECIYSSTILNPFQQTNFAVVFERTQNLWKN